MFNHLFFWNNQNGLKGAWVQNHTRDRAESISYIAEPNTGTKAVTIYHIFHRWLILLYAKITLLIHWPGITITWTTEKLHQQFPWSTRHAPKPIRVARTSYAIQKHLRMLLLPTLRPSRSLVKWLPDRSFCPNSRQFALYLGFPPGILSATPSILEWPRQPPAKGSQNTWLKPTNATSAPISKICTMPSLIFVFEGDFWESASPRAAADP